MRVIKIGGNELGDPDFVTSLAAAIAQMKDETADPLLIVHGGGLAIAELQARLGLEAIKIDGLRVTDRQSLDAAEMVLSGHSNKLLVKALLAAGLDALGLSGIDGALLRCRKKVHPSADLGFVGEITSVRGELLARLAAMDIVTVLSPISLGEDGATYNVNADEAAAAVALATGAAQLDFVSNVPGVLTAGAVIPRLTIVEAEGLIAEGIISGGMIPKVGAALQAVQQGIKLARIVDLAGLASGAGTLFTAGAAAETER